MKITNEDNMDLMARYEDNYFDLAIVDPPYRDEKDNQPTKDMRENGSMKNFGNKPTKKYFNELFRVSKNQIIFGANNFDCLPAYKGFFIYKKKTITEKFTMSMCELAFVSEGLSTVSKIAEFLPQNPNRIHPTQKPVKLYEWLLLNYAKKGNKILDTHLGSMSIAIACHNLGFDLTGCELDKEYYDKGIERLNNHKKQLTII